MLHTLNLVLFSLTASIWVGGMVAVFVFARVSLRTVEPAQRIALFRSLGRVWGMVSTVALLLALVSGAILLGGHPWDGLLIATVIVAVGLLLATGAGVVQARAMTRLRRAALKGDGSGPDLASKARLAAYLRSVIALFTLVLVVLGCVLAS